MKPTLTSILLAAAATASPALAQTLPPPPTLAAPAPQAAPAPARPQSATPAATAPATPAASPAQSAPAEPAPPPTAADLLQTRVEQVKRGNRVVEVRVTGAGGDPRYTMENRQDRPPSPLQGSGSGLSTPSFLKIEF